MAKIIVAFPNDEKNTQFGSALETAGFSVFRCCKSAAEVKRALNLCGESILLTGCRLPDSTVDELAWDVGKRALILVTGRPDQLELCEHPDLFKLNAPCSRGELTSAVNMLVQLYQMRLPKRSAEEKQTIISAKERLMQRDGISEPEAHRMLQHGAMNSGMRLSDYAATILKQENN